MFSHEVEVKKQGIFIVVKDCFLIDKPEKQKQQAQATRKTQQPFDETNDSKNNHYLENKHKEHPNHDEKHSAPCDHASKV